MNSLQYSFVFFILVPHAISFGRCNDVSFSVCWMSKDDALDRKNGDIWLNGTSLKSIRKVGKVTSVTVPPGVENQLTLRYGGSVQAWALTVSRNPRTKFTKVRGRKQPLLHPTNATKDFLTLLSPTEVFACENGTVFFHQEENFFLALGHTMRLPVKLLSRSPSMLLVSWAANHPDVIYSHNMTLYHVELGSYEMHSVDVATHNHYRFSSLDPCSLYMACVEIADTHSLTCLSTITDPDVPKNFEVTSWNSSSISLHWDCPANSKYSVFLLTAFYLNGTDHITEEVSFWHKDNFEFSLSGLQPCSRVKFGLQTVCQAGIESRYSKMVLNDGNSVHSNIEALRQTSFGPNNYTLRWEVKNTSSISMFRVYNKGVLQGTTLINSYTVRGLLPCQQYQAKVEAVCGDGVLMNAKTVTAQTGPHGVSELRYHSNDSTALWKPSSPQQQAVAFVYMLSLKNGTTIHNSRVSVTKLHLPGLEEGKVYLLELWEECDNHLESEHSHLFFEVANTSSELQVRAGGSAQDIELGYDKMGVKMVVPWTLPEDLKDEGSEAKAKLEEIFNRKLQELLKDELVRIKLDTFEPADEPGKTAIFFTAFDVSQTKENVPLTIEELLYYIDSLNNTNITIKDGDLYWEGPDLCASKKTLCSHNSLCINTLGSFSCVCQRDYYDVSSVTEHHPASRPVCEEKGLFSQCLEKLMAGGIAKTYLHFHMGGKVEVKLNDGRCIVNESETLYYFHTSRKSSECGTEKQVNKTHINFHNTLTVTLTKELPISRRELKVMWKCVYPRHYVRNAQVNVDLEWLTSISLVEFNSSALLGLSMTLYRDESYTYSYKDAITLELEDTLFFQVALETNGSFAADLLLQVKSCWTTESTDPQDPTQGVLLQNGCPVDPTFHWLSVNGLAQRSRFSIQMFNMPKRLPLYFHCLASICGQDEDCTLNCSGQQRTKRSVSQMESKGVRAAVVSAGPLIVNTRVKKASPSYWAEYMTVITIVAGSIGFLGVMVLSVSATKAIMAYYEQLRFQ
ncbi:uncharacterized protein LOC115773608 [Archocentrus centrarchus]|uniref:uncharacterized protein LOC115773608 n=1 Tax=Archocentrus centrarchus TaxID=63155 RepID=UPI0011EA35F4|nr:uncharacterized protein LOC115773608 [Archocentrus centrarchus]